MPQNMSKQRFPCGRTEADRNYLQIEETENDARKSRGGNMKKIRMLQMRAVCMLLLLIAGWALLFTHSAALIAWSVCALLFCADCWSKREKLGKEIRSIFSVEAKRNLIYSFGCVFAFVFVTYGFLFSNEFFSHDSVQQTFYSNSPYIFQFYLGIGRFLIPLYEVMKGPYSAPWIIGLFFTIWMTLTCFLITELFRFKGRLIIAMVSGLLCTNSALILTGATYIYCLDEYAVALFASVAAAYCFCKVPQGKILGVSLLIFSLGIYQAYFTVTLALCFMFAVQKLAKNEHAGKAVVDGLKQIGLMLISFCLYFGIWTLLCTIFQVTKIRTDESILGGKISEIITILKTAYVDYFKMFLDTQGLTGYVYVTANVFLLLLIVWVLWGVLRKSTLDRYNKCLIAVAILCAPLVFNSAKIILAGKASNLTGFVCELIYIFFLIWLWQTEYAEKTMAGRIQIVAVILIGCIIYNGVLLANQAYMKKDLEKTATISLVTRIIDRIEQLDGYSPNDTQVYVVGDLRYSDLNRGNMDIPYLESKCGLWYNYSATYNFVRYITDYMNYPMRIAVNSNLADTNDVKNMPAFPANGSVKMIDGAAVIKLS